MGKNKVIIAISLVVLMSTLSWDWTNIKSFVTGGVVVWLAQKYSIV